MLKASDGTGARIALPDAIQPAHGDVDWLALEHVECDVDEYAVPQFDDVVEPVYPLGCDGAAEVVGIDPLESRRALAGRLVVGETVTADKSAWPASREEGRALDASIDCTGLANAVEFLLDRSRLAVGLFGVLREDVRFAPRHMWGPGVSLAGYGDHNHAAAETALAQVLAGKLALAALVAHTLPMSRYVEGVARLKTQQAIKVWFDPWAE